MYISLSFAVTKTSNLSILIHVIHASWIVSEHNNFHVKSYLSFYLPFKLSGDECENSAVWKFGMQ